MNRLSAMDSFGPAMERVRTMLFRPFRLSTWLKIGFIGILGGGVARFNNSMNFRGPLVPPEISRGRVDDPFGELQRAIHSIHLADYAHIIMMALLAALAISMIFLYLFCRFRFVLFDAILSGEAVVGRGWRRYASQANRYFGFWLAFRLVVLATMLLIIGLPLWNAYKSGAFNGDDSLLALFKILGSIALGAFAAGAVFAIISTLMKDFILPIMALDDMTLGDAWTALFRVIQSEPGAWAGYIGMKLVLTIGAGIAMAIATFIALLPVFLVLAIPVGLMIALGIATVKTHVAAAVAFYTIAGILVLFCVLCIAMFVSAPVTVFFAAYAFYFFGGRYPKLGALLDPQPSPVPQMAGAQPMS